MWFYIIGKSGSPVVINPRYYDTIGIEGKQIKLFLPLEEGGWFLAEYETEERAEEVFEKIVEALSSGAHLFRVPQK